MRRREFIAVLGGAAAYPHVAHGQQPSVPVVGFIHSASPEPNQHLLAGFRDGLRAADYVEGKNLAIEYRWAENRYDRLSSMAADLVARRVAVIYADGGTITPIAAQAATSTIPIVFTIGGDPVEAGLVASLSRPGGNITGVTTVTNLMITKRLELLRELLPAIVQVGLLLNPGNANAGLRAKDVDDAAHLLGLQVDIIRAGTAQDLDGVFLRLAERRVRALLVQSDPFFLNQRDQLAALAMRYSIPAIYELREHVAAGGLLSYGANSAEARRQAGVYVGRILKGEKPADLPVMQPTKFELMINLKTAKALGLAVPPSLLARADEVIE